MSSTEDAVGSAANGGPSNDPGSAAALATAREASLKLFRFIQKESAKTAKDDGKQDPIALDRLDKALADLRLHFAVAMFNDPNGTHKNKMDADLWQAHVLVTSAYRKETAAVEAAHHAQKRDLKSRWLTFLRTSQHFYVNLVQRLGTNFGNEGLEEVSKAIGITFMPSEQASPPAGIKDIVHGTVYNAILRLGDLTRYQHEIKPREKYLDRAYLFYSFAQDFDPKPGNAHNQMAVVSDLLHSGHLVLIYHFYMAASGQRTTSMTRRNLVTEFNKVLFSPSGMEPMVSWFVRLHANLYLGKLEQADMAATHSQLENEVLNHVEQAIKGPDTTGVLATFLKMIAINMVAYDVVVKEMAAAGPSEHAIFLKTALMRLNARFAVIFLQALTAELDALGQTFRANLSASEGATTLVTDRTIPCVRLLSVFVVAHWRDLVVPSQHELFHVSHDLYRAIASAGSSLMMLASTETANELLKEAPYMLAEDRVSLGIHSLFDPSMPPGCRLGYCEGSNVRKPVARGAGGTEQLSPYQETFCRIFDITRCNYYITSRPGIPIEVQPTEDAQGNFTLHYAYKTVGDAAAHGLGQSGPSYGMQFVDLGAVAGPAAYAGSGPSPIVIGPPPAMYSGPSLIGPGPYRPNRFSPSPIIPSPISGLESISSPHMPPTIAAISAATPSNIPVTSAPAVSSVNSAPSPAVGLSHPSEALRARVYPNRTVHADNIPRRPATPLDENVRANLFRILEQQTSAAEKEEQEEKEKQEQKKKEMTQLGETSPVIPAPGPALTPARGSAFGFLNNDRMTAPNEATTNLQGGFPSLPMGYFPQPQPASLLQPLPSTNGHSGIAPGLGQALNAAVQGSTITPGAFNQSMGANMMSPNGIRGGFPPASPFHMPSQLSRPMSSIDVNQRAGWSTDYANRLQLERLIHSTPYPQYQPQVPLVQSPNPALSYSTLAQGAARGWNADIGGPMHANASQYVPAYNMFPDPPPCYLLPHGWDPANYPPYMAEFIERPRPQSYLSTPMLGGSDGHVHSQTDSISLGSAQLLPGSDVPSGIWGPSSHGPPGAKPPVRQSFGDWDQDILHQAYGGLDYGVTNYNDVQIPVMSPSSVTSSVKRLQSPLDGPMAGLTLSPTKQQSTIESRTETLHTTQPCTPPPGAPSRIIAKAATKTPKKTRVSYKTPAKKSSKTPKGSSKKKQTPSNVMSLWAPDEQVLQSYLEHVQAPPPPSDWHHVERRLSATRAAYDGLILARVRKSPGHAKSPRS